MSQILFQNMSFTYDGGHVPVFQGLELVLDTDWKLALVGRNGRGKTTLLRLLEGELEHSGKILAPLPCRRFPRPICDPGRSVAEVAAQIAPEAQPWALMRELDLLGLGDELLERPFSTLSGGEQTRTFLAALFSQEGFYPMLDEPTNHLDLQGRELVAGYLRKKRHGFLLVSHDRAFLDQCADHVLALEHSGPVVVAATFSTWLGDKEDRERGEAAQNDKLQREIRQLKESAERSAQWSDQVEATKHGQRNSGLRPDRGHIGHKAAKMMKRSKSIDDRRQKAVEEKQGLLLDLERADPLKLSPAQYHSQRLLEGKNLTISFGNNIVCKGISFTLSQGERLCLTGGNGSGKTSLMRLILGHEVPHTGSFYRASGLKISYLPQTMDHLQGSVRDYARQEGVDQTQLMTILRKLDFSRPQLELDMAQYSQGQKKKVLLAASLCHSAHLYVWDEPLNYIDLFSRMQIEALILAFQPTLLFVEHDKTFAQRVATQTLSL